MIEKSVDRLEEIKTLEDLLQRDRPTLLLIEA